VHAESEVFAPGTLLEEEALGEEVLEEEVLVEELLVEGLVPPPACPPLPPLAELREALHWALSTTSTSLLSLW
jgi:hypothetical protein